MEKPNRNALKIQVQEASKDKRKKECVLFIREGVEHVGKVARKVQKSMVAEHWERINQAEELESFTKCTRCALGNYNNNSCLINIKYEE